MKNVAAFVLFLIWASPAGAESTEEMLSACRKVAVAEIIDGGKVGVPTDFDSGSCWGAFAALQKIVNLVDSRAVTTMPIFHICSPPNSTRTQLVSIFVEYARRHPERLHEDFVFVAFDALRSAFPCRADRKEEAPADERDQLASRLPVQQ